MHFQLVNRFFYVYRIHLVARSTLSNQYLYHPYCLFPKIQNDLIKNGGVLEKVGLAKCLEPQNKGGDPPSHVLTLIFGNNKRNHMRGSRKKWSHIRIFDIHKVIQETPIFATFLHAVF